MLEHFTWFWQSAYRWSGDGLTLYIDPKNVPEGYEPADAIFITHSHFDHFAPEEIDRLRKDDTVVYAPRDIAAELSGDVVAVAPGDDIDVKGVKGQAVPAYNIAEDRLDKHPKEKGWVGYVLTLGDVSIYHAGDTDHLPELEQIKVRAAFVPIGGTFTMDAREAAGLMHSMRPQLAVPMHYGFVEGCGGPDAAETFRELADPVPVEILDPEQPFELS
jgi:L-ascorbate metabolism protein UlaG (beta-lactamase superfamily)